MNTLTALFLWFLSQLAPSEVVCAKFELPPEVCENERVPTEQERNDASPRRDEGERRVRADLAPRSASHISNGF